jgi:methanogenic corrinoid protein MtbC1
MSTDTEQQEVSRALDARRRNLAEAVTERQYELRPDLAERYGERGRAHCLKDAEYHLSYLADAIASGSPALFADYVGWAKVMLATRGIPAEDLAVNLETLRDVLRRELPEEMAAVAGEYVQSGLESLPGLPSDLRTRIGGGEPLGDLAREYLDALLRGERSAASRMVLDAVEKGKVPVKDVYLHVFQRTQHEIGRLWQTNRLSVAQEHYCTAATQLIMSQLYPYIFAGPRNGRSLVATCVSGDLHEIGVRMISDFFEMEGWDTFYVGANAPKADLLRTLAERRADVLAVSATMTFHVRAVADLIAGVHEAHGDRVKVLVGGYPFNVDPGLWRTVGADASARDAAEAIELAGGLTGGFPR